MRGRDGDKAKKNLEMSDGKNWGEGEGNGQSSLKCAPVQTLTIQSGEVSGRCLGATKPKPCCLAFQSQLRVQIQLSNHFILFPKKLGVRKHYLVGAVLQCL